MLAVARVYLIKAKIVKQILPYTPTLLYLPYMFTQVDFNETWLVKGA